MTTISKSYCFSNNSTETYLSLEEQRSIRFMVAASSNHTQKTPASWETIIDLYLPISMLAIGIWTACIQSSNKIQSNREKRFSQYMLFSEKFSRLTTVQICDDNISGSQYIHIVAKFYMDGFIAYQNNMLTQEHYMHFLEFICDLYITEAKVKDQKFNLMMDNFLIISNNNNSLRTEFKSFILDYVNCVREQKKYLVLKSFKKRKLLRIT